ncbi:MAG: alpha/beta hydrolase, partial [Gemmataceae bacterium]
MLFLQLFLASESCSQAPIRKVEQIPDSVIVQRDIRFLPAGRAERADIYRPAAQTPSAKKLPAVVIIHGGGFNSGDKGNAREINI